MPLLQPMLTQALPTDLDLSPSTDQHQAPLFPN